MLVGWELIGLFSGPVYGARFLEFAGRTWLVKESESRVGPGPNYFSGSASDIWTDSDGLHLTISQQSGKWYCTECILQENLGYGTYVIQTRSRLDRIDPNMVAGLFTWDGGAPQYHYRELDFEFSRWGNPLDPTNAQFVVQPYATPGNLVRYAVELSSASQELTLIMNWTTGRVEFSTYHGHHFPGTAPPEDLIYHWTNNGPDVPPAGQENFRFNFWLIEGNPPQSGFGNEFLVTDFFHFPPTSPPNSLVLDHFEDGNKINNLQGIWTTFSGNDTGPSSTIIGQLQVPGLGNSSHAFQASGALPGFAPSFNYGGLVTELSKDIQNNQFDASRFHLLEFDFSVSMGGPYQVRLEDKRQTYNSTNIPITTHPGETERISFPLSLFANGPNPVDLRAIQKIVWTLQTDSSGSPFGITVDNIQFTKKSEIQPTPTPTPIIINDILIDDLEDNDFSNHIGGNWEVFDGNGICNPCGALSKSIVHPGLGNSNSAFSATGSIPPAEGGYSFAGVVTRFGPSMTDTMDLNGYEALEFNILKTEGSSYSVRLEDRSHVAAGFKGYLQPHVLLEDIDQPKLIHIPLLSFTTGSDGVNLSEVSNIVWVPTESHPGEGFGLVIDNVKFSAPRQSGMMNWPLY